MNNITNNSKILVSLASLLALACALTALSIYINIQHFAQASNKSAPSQGDSINLLMPCWFTFPWQKAIYGMQKSWIFNLAAFSFPLDSEYITGDGIKIKAWENQQKESHWSQHVTRQVVF